MGPDDCATSKCFTDRARERSLTRRSWSALVPVLALAGLCACQHDPKAHEYARTKPDLEGIVGSWIVTDATVHDLARTRYAFARPRIELGADGTIKLTDIPDNWRDPTGAGEGALEEFVGTWLLAQEQDRWGLQLRRGDWVCSDCVMVVGQRAPYRLVVGVGDPDAGLGYEFRRDGR